MKVLLAIVFTALMHSSLNSQEYKFENENKYDMVNFFDKGIENTPSDAKGLKDYFSTKIFGKIYNRLFNKLFTAKDINTFLKIEVPEMKFASAQNFSTVHITIKTNRFPFRKNSNSEFLLSDIWIKNSEHNVFDGLAIDSDIEQVHELIKFPNYRGENIEIYRAELQNIVFKYKDGKVVEIQYHCSDGL